MSKIIYFCEFHEVESEELFDCENCRKDPGAYPCDYLRGSDDNGKTWC